MTPSRSWIEISDFSTESVFSSDSEFGIQNVYMKKDWFWWTLNRIKERAGPTRSDRAAIWWTLNPGTYQFLWIFHVYFCRIAKNKGYSKSAMLYKYRIKLFLVYSVYSITLSNYFSQTSLKWVYGILWHFMGSWHFENAHWLWITILNLIRLEKEIWKL